MNAQNWLVTARWPGFRLMLLAAAITALTACTATTSTAPETQDEVSADAGDRPDGSATDKDGRADNDQKADKDANKSAKNALDKAALEKAVDQLCDRPTANLAPLSAPENMPIYEQFNFQPQRISASDVQVTIKTTYHTFSYCKKTGEWAIANRRPSEEAPFNYEQYLQELAEPNYESIQVNGQNYAYRVRLQASWLTKQVEDLAATATSEPARSESISSTSNATEASEEAVYFDLKLPSGRVITRQLYSLTDVQEASLGASLGVPSIADAIKADNAIWFAATTSQGEGENGFASLLRYDLKTKTLNIHQPTEIQGDQITSLVATNSSNPQRLAAGESAAGESTAGESADRNAADRNAANRELANNESANGKSADGKSTDSESANGELTLWLGTLRSAEGNPFFPASGLVSYQPTSDSDGIIRQHTIHNSPMVGAIPYQLSAFKDELWVATGSGICQTQWLTIEQDSSWRCWEFTATAPIPSEGIDLYPSFLAEKPATQLTESNVEVLWANWEHFDQPDVDKAGAFRYEVVYEPGFEADLAQGGHRLDNEVAQRMARGNDIFWPGQQWHWSGQRFKRSLDEVALNLVGGGPYGLMASNIQTGRSFDHYAIRGDFDLLSLKPDGTRVRYYSGWVAGKDLAAYPAIVEVEKLEAMRPNPITSIAADLPPVGP